jgi:GGDEF domain-containing protein
MIESCVGSPEVIVARLRGDEFGFLLSAISSPEIAIAATQNLRHALAKPFAIAGQNIPVTAGMGNCSQLIWV